MSTSHPTAASMAAVRYTGWSMNHLNELYDWQIPGSTWFGDADGFGFLTGNAAEPLHLELAGLDEDHYVMASVEHFGGDH